MKNKYYLLFKTGDAEIRALENTKFDSSKIFPIIELTRGRITKNDKVGLLSKRLEKIGKIFYDQMICIDLTTNEDLSNSEIQELYESENGYFNWVKFLSKVKNEYFFKEVVPTILVDTEDPNLNDNLLKQVQQLSKSFNKLIYRNNIIDEGYWEDLQVIKNYINSHDKLELIFLFDCEYVPSGAVRNTFSVINARITKIKALIPKTRFIIVSSSFPRYVSDIGNDDYDIFPLSEIDIYNGVKEAHTDVLYGDYGSINPIRNDTIVMARGWIPRIDVPTLGGIYYYRQRNVAKDYAYTYSLVAKKSYSDPKFPGYLKGNWGISQIITCKEGSAPGSSPSFWISVRLSIFIEMQLKRLGLN